MKECCILQMEAVHEEVLPSLIYVLNNLGYSPSIYINIKSKIRKGSIFEYCKDLKYSIKYVQFGHMTKWTELRTTINKQRNKFDFLIITTYQKDRMAEFYNEFEIPLIGIIHNGKLFKNNKVCLDSIKNNKVYGLCLAKHAAIYVRNQCGLNQDNLAYYEPFYMDDTSFNSNSQALKIDDTIYIGITGSVVFNDRDFHTLITKLKNINKNKLKNKIKFSVCGGGKDRKELELMIKDSKLSDFFLLAPSDKDTGYVSYKEYMKSLKMSHFLISLFKDTATHYLQFKISSVITSSLAYNIPMLFDHRASIIYSNPALNYSFENFEESMIDLSNINQESYNILYKESCDYRNFVVKNSTNQIKRMISYVT